MAITTDIERLIQLFVDAEKYIDRLIAETVKANPTARSLVFWKRRSQLVHQQLTYIRREILNQTPDVINASYKAGLEIVVAKASHYEIDKRLNFGSGVNTRAAALLAAGMNDRLDMALVTVGRRADDAFRRAGLRASAYHAIAGTDARQAAKQMEAMLRRDGTRAFVDKAGREWSLQNYTRMVIRTTTREAITQGTYNGLVATDHELFQVSHHVNSCKMCLPFDGNTYCLPTASDALKARYPVMERIPPYHPNCKHVIAPSGAEFDIIEARLLEKYGAVA